MSEDVSGADLVRAALDAAHSARERWAALRAAAEATRALAALLRIDWDQQTGRIHFSPVTVARQHVIRELRAASRRDLPTPAGVEFFNSFQQRVYEAELKKSRQLAAQIVRRSLRPPAR
jgi:hypothetical protein